jgi:PKHD-type hydroxylase
MILKNYYYWFESALSDNVCDMIMQIGKSKQESKAILDREADVKDLSKVRNSNVAWISEKFVYDSIHPFIHEANKKAGWNFQWDYSEACQFTKYDKEQFYEWHPDQSSKPYHKPDDKGFHGKIRKLSVTVSLSHPDEYDGGNLEFDFKNHREKENKIVCKEIRPRGSIIVFPSFVFHRVTPVTRGTRYSLVMWNLGKPYQ